MAAKKTISHRILKDGTQKDYVYRYEWNKRQKVDTGLYIFSYRDRLYVIYANVSPDGEPGRSTNRTWFVMIDAKTVGGPFNYKNEADTYARALIDEALRND